MTEQKATWIQRELIQRRSCHSNNNSNSNSERNEVQQHQLGEVINWLSPTVCRSAAAATREMPFRRLANKLASQQTELASSLTLASSLRVRRRQIYLRCDGRIGRNQHSPLPTLTSASSIRRVQSTSTSWACLLFIDCGRSAVTSICVRRTAQTGRERTRFERAGFHICCVRSSNICVPPPPLIPPKRSVPADIFRDNFGAGLLGGHCVCVAFVSSHHLQPLSGANELTRPSRQAVCCLQLFVFVGHQTASNTSSAQPACSFQLTRT